MPRVNIVVLAGGIGGARFLSGVRQYAQATPGTNVTAIVNTADDITLHGLRVCPDLDSVMYTLGDGIDTDRGWGRRDETFHAAEELAAYGAGPEWFGLGDRDLATHLIRTRMLDAGYSLTDVTAALCARWSPGITVLPMCDERVETHVIVDDGNGRRALHFQEWWLKHRAALPAQEFVQVGNEDATLTAAVNEALAEADVVLIAPSNPVVSVAPVLGVPGLRDALGSMPIIGVSPIVGGAPVRGHADACLAAIGVEVDAAAVARHYGARAEGGLLDGWVMDDADADAAAALRASDVPMRVATTNTVMRTPAIGAALAATALDLAAA
jgi:LPPG:FO 2-phospho-L-lactate transferase